MAEASQPAPVPIPKVDLDLSRPESSRDFDEFQFTDLSAYDTTKDPSANGDPQDLLPVEPEVDYTKIPSEIESKLTDFDVDNAVRPTIINVAQQWTKRFTASLLAQPTEKSMSVAEQESERNKAFDLLDALTRSGNLDVSEASLHVVMAATHCFDQTLMDTLIQRNMNPIERIERSALIVASSVHQATAKELVRPEQVERLETYSAKKFLQSS